MKKFPDRPPKTDASWSPNFAPHPEGEKFTYMYDVYYNDYRTLVTTDLEDMVEIPFDDCNYRCYKECDKKDLCRDGGPSILPNSKAHLWIEPDNR